MSLSPRQVQERADAWAATMFEPPCASALPSPGWAGRQTQAVVLQTEDREPDLSAKHQQRRLARNAEVRKAIAYVEALVKAGDLTAASEAVQALQRGDLPRVYWCDSVSSLAAALADCLRHGEQCYESGAVEGPAGYVTFMFVWYDPSHPV